MTAISETFYGSVPEQPREDVLADYLRFAGEMPPSVPLIARTGFAEQLTARIPKDRRGRSLAELDLDRRLFRYPCSFMIYSEAFDGLPAGIKRAIYRRLETALAGTADGRVALEILRNAYRHARATRIEAEIRYDYDILRIRIRDNGRGIDPTLLKDGGVAGHWGLRGVRERAERIGARLDFWSEAGAGTEVQLTVPAEVAFETSRESLGSRLLQKVKSRARYS